MKFDASLFEEPTNGLDLNDNTNVDNSSDEDLNPDDVFNKAVDGYLENTPIEKDAVSMKQTYKQAKRGVQTVQSEDNATTVSLEEVTPEEGDWDWHDGWDDFRQTVGTKTANFYDGVESAMVNLATEQVGAKAKAMNTIVGLFTNTGIDRGQIDELLPKVKDEVKASLRISKHINDFVGFKYLNSIEDINDDMEAIDVKREEIDSIGLDAIHMGGEIIGELGLLKHAFSPKLWDSMFKKSMREITHKDIGAQALASGAIAGAEEYSESDQDLGPTMTKALQTVLWTAAGGEVFKGGIYAKDNLFMSSATKTTAGLEEHALSGVFKDDSKALEAWKKDIADNSEYLDWEHMPNYLKDIALMTKSQNGKALQKMTNRMEETADAMKNLASNASDEMDNIFSDVTELSKKVYTESGLPVKNSLDSQVSSSTTTLGQDILANSGILKKAPMRSGVKPTNVGSAHYDIYEAIVAGNYEANKEKLTSAMRVLGISRKKGLESLLVDSAEHIQHPKPVMVDDFIDDIVKNVAVDMKKTGVELDPSAVGRNFADEREILKSAVEKEIGSHPNHIDELTGEIQPWEGELSPRSIYNIRQNLKDSADKFYGDKGLDSTLNQSLDNAVIESMSMFGKDGKKFTNTLRGILDIERTRADLISRAGIKGIAENGHLMSAPEMQKAFYEMRNMADDDWKKMVASLGSRKEQEMFEMYYLKSVAYKGHNNMADMMDNLLHGGSKDGSTATKRSVASRETELGMRKLHTLKGRQMQHSLTKLTQLFDGVTEGLPTMGDDISYQTEVRKKIARFFNTYVVGVLQTKKGAAQNPAYVLHNMDKLMKKYRNNPKTGFTKESLAKGYAKGDSTIDLSEFPMGAETVSMLENLRKLQGIDDIGTPPAPANPTPPVTPTPPTGGVAPSPMPIPTAVTPTPPKSGVAGLPTKVINSIMDTGRINDQLVLMPVEIKAIESLQDDILTKMTNVVLDDHQAGKLPNATLESSAEWVAYNKELTKAQEGSNMKIVINPAGEPRLIVGKKGVGKWINEDRLRADLKGGQGFKDISEYIDVDDMHEMATKLGKPNLFKTIEVKMNEALDIQRGSSGSTISNSRHEINVGTKGKGRKGGDDEFKALLQSINETLFHEVQHTVQSTFGLHGGSTYTGKAGEHTQEMIRRTNELVDKYKITRTDEQVINSVMNDRGTHLSENQWNEFIDYDGQSYNTKPSKQDVYSVISSRYGIDPSELMSAIPDSHFKLYRQSMGEAESTFVEILARNNGVDLSDDTVFDKFMQSEGEYLEALWTLNPDYKRLGGTIQPPQQPTGHP